MKKVSKMDEMDRNIFLRSESLAYKVAVVALSLWVIFSSYKSLVYNFKYNPIPVLILCLTISVQNFSRIYIKNKMVNGDEDYRESNKFMEILVLSLSILAIIIFIGIEIF
ncbi:MAG: hypothetical protein E7C82_07190 [Anaerococcus hydrogenalis]|uniref:hypothetical protein n=1 Tax=Anaerococcus hydrogenalis TaxID=33029 RepID=UPI002901CE25|nr:hypothetical protein [Anaerococcus hydrogenalis]MDU2583475.1 hypothetical protein [Anaerococcus hydrogenalis]